jgi:hypothetical protein
MDAHLSEGLVCTVGRHALVAVLIGTLISLPAFASPAAPLGMVIEAQDARLGQAQAAGGATVFTGDKIETGAKGTIRVRFNPGQVYLLSSTKATIVGGQSGVTTTLSHGTAGFTTTGDAPIELHAETAVVRPTSAATTHAQVTIVSAKELIVSNFHGPLEVEVAGDKFAIPENTAYRVILQSSQDPNSGQTTTDQDQGGSGGSTSVKYVKKSHALLVLIGAAGAGVAVGYGIYRLTMSPSTP